MEKILINIDGDKSELSIADYKDFLSNLYNKNGIIFLDETFDYLLWKTKHFDGDVYGNIPEYARPFMHKLLKAGIIWKYGEYSPNDPPIKEYSSAGNFDNPKIREMLDKALLGLVHCPIRAPYVNLMDNMIYMPYMTSFREEVDYAKALLNRYTKFLFVMTGESKDTIKSAEAYFDEHGNLADMKSLLGKMGIF